MFLRKLKKAPVFKQMMLMNRVLKEIGDSAYSITKHRLLYTINISYNKSVFEEFLTEHFTHADDIFQITRNIKNDEDAYPTFTSAWSMAFNANGINSSDFAIIDGVPCMIHMHCRGGGSDNNSAVNSCWLLISTLRYGDYPDRLREILKKASMEYNKKAEEEALMDYPLRIVTTSNGANMNQKKMYIRKRNFDNVFVPSEIRTQITNALDNFVAKKEWYKENVIPYHFGIMLYGPPGTGKTSLAQAIANYLPGSRLLYLTGDMISKLPTMIENDAALSRGGTDRPTVFLIEDIDCGFGVDSIRSRRNKYENADEDEMSNGLGTILNSLDGIIAPSNVIFIFTTNHIDQLDPALIRPGRIDLMLEIKPICMETFKEFMVHHYGENVKIPKTLKLKDDVTFAKLQIMVMSGSSATDIINYVKEKDNAE